MDFYTCMGLVNLLVKIDYIVFWRSQTELESFENFYCAIMANIQKYLEIGVVTLLYQHCGYGVKFEKWKFSIHFLF